MDEGISFGDLSAQDKNIVSTDRSAFTAMNAAFSSRPRSTQAENSNSTEFERFEIVSEQVEFNSNPNNKQVNASVVRFSTQNSSADATYNADNLSKKLNSVHIHTNDNSSCRFRNLNNSVDRNENSTETGNSQDIEVSGVHSEGSFISVESEENLNSTRIANSTTTSLTDLAPKEQRKRLRTPDSKSNKMRKLEDYFRIDNSTQNSQDSVSEFNRNIFSQDVIGVLGQETISTQTSPSRIDSINSRQAATSSRISNKFFKNTPNSTDFGMQTEDSILDLSETRKEKNRKAIKDLELEIDQAMNRIRITNSTTNFLDLTMTPSDSQRIQVPIYPPALTIWKQLRSLQTRKIILQVRSEFYRKIREENGIPEWAVMFNPPHNLLQTERAIEAVVGFRAEMARNNLQMLEDLFSEEIERLSKEINASTASLRVHYDDINSTDYDLEQATSALNRFMLRAQTQEQNSMSKKYNSIMEAPHAALWKNLPAHATPPASAVPPKTPSKNCWEFWQND